MDDTVPIRVFRAEQHIVELVISLPFENLDRFAQRVMGAVEQLPPELLKKSPETIRIRVDELEYHTSYFPHITRGISSNFCGCPECDQVS
jgi:hypothetical protein